MGEFNSDDNYIYYCGQESHRRNAEPPAAEIRSSRLGREAICAREAASGLRCKNKSVVKEMDKEEKEKRKTYRQRKEGRGGKLA